MNCPVCNGKTKVIDSRSERGAVGRRRRCLKCDYVFCTIELEDEQKDINRITKNYLYDLSVGKGKRAV